MNEIIAKYEYHDIETTLSQVGYLDEIYSMHGVLFERVIYIGEDYICVIYKFN